MAAGIAALGTGGAGLLADGIGALAGKNKEDPLKATKGAMKGMAGAAAINAGIAGAAGLAEAAPAVTGLAMQHPDKIRAAGDFVQGAFDPGPAPLNFSGLAGAGANKVIEWTKRKQK